MTIDVRYRPPTEPFTSIYDNRVFHDLLVRARYKPETQKLDEALEECKSLGLTGAVVGGRDVESTYGYRVSNDHVAEVCEADPEFFRGLAGADPNKGPEALSELKRAIEDLGLHGLTLDPFMHKRPIDDAIYSPLLSYCEDRGLPVMLTCGPGGLVPESVLDDVHPMRIDKVAANYPNLKLIMSHSGWPFVLESIALCFRHRHVYMDLSGYALFPGARSFVDAANGIIRDKVMFASGHPYVTVEQSLAMASKLELTDKSRDPYMHANAARLFDF